LPFIAPSRPAILVPLYFSKLQGHGAIRTRSQPLQRFVACSNSSSRLIDQAREKAGLWNAKDFARKSSEVAMKSTTGD
jgi:hypothetical protein